MKNSIITALLITAAYSTSARADFVVPLSVREVFCTDSHPFTPVVPGLIIKLVGTREGLEISWQEKLRGTPTEYFNSTAALNLASEGGYYIQFVDNNIFNLTLAAESELTYDRLLKKDYADGEQFHFRGQVNRRGAGSNLFCSGTFNKQ